MSWVGRDERGVAASIPRRLAPGQSPQGRPLGGLESSRVDGVTPLVWGKRARGPRCHFPSYEQFGLDGFLAFSRAKNSAAALFPSTLLCRSRNIIRTQRISRRVRRGKTKHNREERPNLQRSRSTTRQCSSRSLFLAGGKSLIDNTHP